MAGTDCTARVAGLLLAAGEGSRLGRPKALIELNGQRLAERGAAMLGAAGCDPVLVVLGAAITEVTGARVVTNPEWATGMGSSLRAGLGTLPEASTAVVIALADQPRVGPEAVRRLVRAHESGAAVAVATYDGAPRNPVLLDREHWPAVAAAAVGDVGARPFLRAHPELVTSVECGDIAAPDDIDTPGDLARLTNSGDPCCGPGDARGPPSDRPG